MNEALKISANGIRLLTDWEKGPSDGSVPLTEGGAARTPYVCPGGELTAGYGCTKWFGGGEVEIHCTLANEEEAIALLLEQLVEYEEAVRRLCTREPNQNQFDAFVCLAFNIGIGNFAASSALEEFNAGRFEDAAANFGKWTGATCDRPPKKERNNPDYAPKMAQDHKGGWRWVGPEGQYCRYMLRYVGLLSRHYSEALLFMSKDWTAALREGGIKLDLEATTPSEAKWNAAKARWEDDVRYRTPFKDVLAFAYHNELPGAVESLEPASEDQPSAATQPASALQTAQADSPDPAILILDKPAPGSPPPASGGLPPSRPPLGAGQPIPPAGSNESFPGRNTVGTGPVVTGAGGAKGVSPSAPSNLPPPPKPHIVAYPDRIDVEGNLKPIDESQRAHGYVWQSVGICVLGFGALGVFGSSFAAAFEAINKSPAISNALLMLFVSACTSGVGFCKYSYGTWKRRRGEARATQGLK